jgi:hypothetical protein
VSLIEELRAIEDFTPSHQPTVGETPRILGVLIAYIEHGDALLAAGERDAKAKAAGEPSNEVNELLWPSPEPAEPAAAGGETRIAELEQQVQTLLAQQGRTEATVTSGEPEGSEPKGKGR